MTNRFIIFCFFNFLFSNLFNLDNLFNLSNLFNLNNFLDFLFYFLNLLFNLLFWRWLNILFCTSNHELIVCSFLHFTDFSMNSIFLEFNSSINLICFCLWQLSRTTDFFDQRGDVFFVILIICNLVYQFFIARFKFICLFNLCIWCWGFNYYWTILLDFC